MSDIEEFEFWLGAYLENPKAVEGETSRLLQAMCAAGNVHALKYSEQQRVAFERAASADIPINTFGNLDFADEPKVEADSDSAVSLYPDNWFEIANSLKTRRNWKCELCSFQSVDSSLIQVHHIDRDKSDNQPSNLQVLCAICHGQKHGNPPIWPTGVSDEARQRLMSHHDQYSLRIRRE